MYAVDAGSAVTSSRFWREIGLFDELMTKLRALNVDSTEYACLKGIVLFKTGASAAAWRHVTGLCLNFITSFLLKPYLIPDLRRGFRQKEV